MTKESMLTVKPYFTVSPEFVNWVDRDASITDAKGQVIFEQKNVRFPDFWSQQAINITVHKYFKGPLGTLQRETQLDHVIDRVTSSMENWAQSDGYLDRENACVFRAELTYILTHQIASFNSPVWFNVGVVDESSSGYVWDKINGTRQVGPGEHHPQCSACFITAPEDNMSSILDWVKTEGMIFKQGSGSGCNISKVRSSKERLSSGGMPSGPLAFMQIADQAAGSIKSGGKHRRAAKLVCMDVTHPDILEFIACKAKEERKARKLIEAGWSAEFNDPENAYHQVFYQNANHSISVSNQFMKQALNGGHYFTNAVTSGANVDALDAGEVLHAAAVAAWECGDPGVQFNDTTNLWNTVLGDDRIRSSNPCGEYLFLDNTACNLASINLLKFLKPDGSFDIEAFCHVVNLLILAQDLIVDRASYPTPEIARRSHQYRTLGLGFANLGAYLMASKLPYDSEEGRQLAGAITSLMTSQAYWQSSRIADQQGSFERYDFNRGYMDSVLSAHLEASKQLHGNSSGNARRIAAYADRLWWSEIMTARGFRNAQVTVVAPTGTIGFMMDCDTTGIEPELALVKYKKLVGGGQMKIVNQTVERALGALGYGVTIPAILDYVKEHGTLEGSGIKDEDLAIFDTSFPADGHTRAISYMAHVLMMAAVQPFISGGISKTVNMPSTATPDEIVEVYKKAWELGLKSVTVYRDGCKQSQPLSVKKELKALPQHGLEDYKGSGGLGTADQELRIAALLSDPKGREWLAAQGLVPKDELQAAQHRPYHHQMPRTRQAVCHKFRIAGHTGYLHVGLYDDGAPGEIFITMAKEGSTISGLMDAFATSVSFNLQYGVPLERLVSKFKYMKFEPSGWTENEEIHLADSVVDYIFKFLEHQFLEPQRLDLDKGEPIVVAAAQPAELNPELDASHREYWLRPHIGAMNSRPSMDAPICTDCGQLMVRNGACFKCENCGGTSGCS